MVENNRQRLALHETDSPSFSGSSSPAAAHRATSLAPSEKLIRCNREKLFAETKQSRDIFFQEARPGSATFPPSAASELLMRVERKQIRTIAAGTALALCSAMILSVIAAAEWLRCEELVRAIVTKTIVSLSASGSTLERSQPLLFRDVSPLRVKPGSESAPPSRASATRSLRTAPETALIPPQTTPTPMQPIVGSCVPVASASPSPRVFVRVVAPLEPACECLLVPTRS